MASPTKRFDIVAGRPYTTRDGETKKQWINVGRATEWDDGGISLEMHAVPVGSWFDGKLSLFESKPKDGQPRQAPQASAADPFADDSLPAF